jgi:hypothetical protein
MLWPVVVAQRRSDNGRLEPVGQESFEATAESPFSQNGWRAQKAMNEVLVIALEKDSFFGPLASEQKIQHFFRGRSPVDIVANKNHDRATGWYRVQSRSIWRSWAARRSAQP